MSTNIPNPSEPVGSVRLIFEYEGNNVRLVSQQPVDVAVTGFDLSQTSHPGYYIEARDAGNITLARVPARDAFSNSMEVFPENHKDPITRHDVAQPKGAFTVIVPAPAATHHVTVMQIVPGKPAAALQPGIAAVPPRPEAIDLVSFPLTARK
jgi:hypothetical protein